MAISGLPLQWDDHEVVNNWWPGQVYTGAKNEKKPAAYTGMAANDLAKMARQVGHVYAGVG